MSIELRSIEVGDLEELVELCAEHAAYERGEYSAEGKREALAAHLFGPSPRVQGLVAAAPQGLVGYATWSREFSTWGACEFLHMDCLFFKPAWRGRGLGARMLHALAEICVAEGLSHMEWQSPLWNEQALRFYRRQGASGSEKVRFRFDCDLGLLEPSAGT